MKDLDALDKKLTNAINSLGRTGIVNDASARAPVSRNDIDALRSETANALRLIQQAVIDYLKE